MKHVMKDGGNMRKNMHTDILKHLYTSQDIKDGSQFKSSISSSYISEIINRRGPWISPVPLKVSPF